MTQTDRIAALETPLGKDVLLVQSVTITEQLGRLFQMELDLVSTDPEVSFDDIVGQKATVRVTLQNRKQRFFNGFISRFVQSSSPDRHAHYRATVVPWLWFLTRTADCRIFQKKSIPTIIEEVFSDEGFTDFRLALSGNYPPWEFCVQYRETDFNFVSRLMEQEGMFYYFEHENGKHTLVITDSNKTLKPYPEYASIPYRPDTHDLRDKEIIFEWLVEKQVQPGAYAVNDFNFTTPSAVLQAKSNIDRPHAKATFEVYDYPGEYEEQAEGQDYSQVRLEELQAQHELVRGRTNARGVAAGSVFKLADYPRKDQNRDYLITSASYHITSPLFESGGHEAASLSSTFTAIPLADPFRPVRITPKPLIQGPQTAIVVGPAGEEIHTDDQARVKVQFHWDRYGQRDENSSCFIRVSQANAGKGWGSMITPRIGQEVIVEFLEGDPDRPIITGRVYNGENAPPFASGGGVTSGIKSQTHKGSGSNEIGLDDTAGKENFKMNAQFDNNNTVGNDQNNSVTNNKTTSVGVDHSETVGSNQTIKVGANQSVTVGSNQSISVGACETETVAIAKALSIGAGYQVSVGAGMNETIGAVKGEQIGGAKIVAVGGISKELVGGSKSVTAGSSISAKAGSKMSMVAAAGISAAAGGKMALSSRGNFSANGKAKGIIEMATQLVLKCGGASITLKSGGDILIKGTNIKIQGSKVDIKSSGDVKIKGSKIGEN